MINPQILTILAWIPIAIVASTLYWLIMIKWPSAMLDNWRPTPREQFKASAIAHAIVIAVIAFAFSLYFLSNKERLTLQYENEKNQKLQEAEFLKTSQEYPKITEITTNTFKFTITNAITLEK